MNPVARHTLTAVLLPATLLVACAQASRVPVAAETTPTSCEAAPVASPASEATAAPALPSWRDTATRKAILDFVQRVTTEGSEDFVPEAERIAVFDNDGTLWSEQPMYVQLAFALDRVKALAAEHPEWRKQQPFKAALEGDMQALAEAGTKGLLELVVATHAGMDTEAFADVVTTWLAGAKHPTYGRPYTELVYAPMVELLGYLREHGFKTFIASGGGIAFMRPWVEAVYGVPPEQVVGSRIELAWQMTPRGPALLRQPKLDFIDDGAGKPVGIENHIGRRPVFAAGNSDGDLQMLQWTAAGDRPSLQLLVHHTDGEREVAYDKESAIGHLDAALTEAQEKGWVVVDVAADWGTVFAPGAAASE